MFGRTNSSFNTPAVWVLENFAGIIGELHLKERFETGHTKVSEAFSRSSFLEMKEGYAGAKKVGTDVLIARIGK